MQKDIAQLKKEFDSGMYEEVLTKAERVLGNDPDNKFVLLFKGSALAKQDQPNEAIETLEHGFSMLQVPQDDQLQFRYNKTLIESADKLLESGTQKQKKRGLDLKITYQKSLVDFLFRKEKWDSYVEEAHTLAMLYQENDMYAEAETLYYQMMKNKALDNATRHRAGVNIFTMSVFHHPKTKLQDEFNEIVSLQPDHQDNAVLGEKLLKELDKKPLVSINQIKPENMQEFIQDSKVLISTCDSLYLNAKPSEEFVANVLVKQNSVFFKYVTLTTLFYEYQSPKWDKMISLFRGIKELPDFQELVKSQQETSYPLASLIMIMIDINEAVNKEQHLVFISADRELSLKVVVSMKKLLKTSPVIPIFMSEYLINTHKTFDDTKMQIDSGLNLVSDLRKQPDFINGHEYEAKLLIQRCTLIINDVNGKDKQNKAQLFEQSIEQLEGLTKLAKNGPFVESILSKLRYQFKLSQNDWKGAKEILDKLSQQEGAKNLDWVQSQRAWLTYSYIDKIASDQAERIQLIKASQHMLSQALKINPKNVEVLARLGTLYYHYEKELGVSPKQDAAQWLGALRIDQANPETFYCLAIYYYTKEKDVTRTIKCLDKALQLKPDFEDAGLLYFKVMMDEGDEGQAYGLLQRTLKYSSMVMYPYYLEGIKLQNRGEYLLAIENFQNAAKFHSIAQMHKEKTKPSYPRLRDASKSYPERGIQYFADPLGIFNSHAVTVWYHLTECFIQIKRPASAQKCMYKMFSELENVVTYESEDAAKQNIGAEIPEIKTMAEFVRKISKDAILDENLKNVYRYVEEKVSSKEGQLLKETVPAFILASKVLYIINEFDQMLKVIAQVLRILSLNLLPENLTPLALVESIGLSMESLTALIESSSGGQADRKNLQKHRFLTYLATILDQTEQLSVTTTQSSDLRFQKLKADCYVTLTLENHSNDILKAKALLENLAANKETTQVSQFHNAVLLDLAKLYHLCEVRQQNQDLDFNDLRQRKLQMIRKLIKDNPENVEYWVTYSILSDETSIKHKALLKALQLEPHNQLALNNLLCCHWRMKQFKASFQTLTLIRDVDSMNALSMAILVLLNAKLALEDSGIPQYDKQMILSEAASIGSMFLEIEEEDVKHDILQRVLREQLNKIVTLLLHELGDYTSCHHDLVEIFEENTQDSHILGQMVLLSSLGCNLFNDLERVKKVVQDIMTRVEMGDSHISTKISELLEAGYKPTKQETSDLTETKMAEFIENPTDLNALKLVAFQEKCLDFGIQIKQTLFDKCKKDKIPALLDQVSKEHSSLLVQQSLRVIFDKTKTIKSLQPHLDYLTIYRGVHLRYYLPNIEYEKLFKFHLLNLTDRQALRRGVKMLQSLDENALSDLVLDMQQQSQQRQKLLYLNVMKRPHALSGYNEWIWHLLRAGKIHKVKRAIRVVKTKLDSDIIHEKNQEEELQLKDLELLLCAIQNRDVKLLEEIKLDKFKFVVLIIQAFIDLINLKQSDPAVDKQQLLSELTDNLIKSIGSTRKPEEQEDLVDLFYMLANKLLLEQGYLLTFNEIAQQLLKHLDSQELVKINDFFNQELKAYLLLNYANNMVILKKLATANKLSNEATAVVKHAKMRMDGSYLLIATISRQLKNTKQAEATLQKAGDLSYEGDFLSALVQYDQQQYKEFYLSSMGLVASLKKNIELAHTDDRAVKRLKFLLGYAYYLKGAAENVFFLAKKKGITLNEDFVNEEAQTYNLEYFQRKMDISIQKAKKLLSEYPQIIEVLEKPLPEE